MSFWTSGDNIVIVSEGNQLGSQSKTSGWVVGKFLSQGKRSEESAEAKARWNEAQRNRTGESAEAEAQVNPRDGSKHKGIEPRNQPKPKTRKNGMKHKGIKPRNQPKPKTRKKKAV